MIQTIATNTGSAVTYRQVQCSTRVVNIYLTHGFFFSDGLQPDLQNPSTEIINT